MTQRFTLILCAVLLLVSPLALGATEASVETPAADAFAKLKTLAGTWHGEAKTFESEETSPVTHVFRVASNGSVVMETMNPDTDHEMINMYHLDGDDLVLTHYCASGNQPTMKMVKAENGTLHFDFTGGTNLDPATDGHIHAGRLHFNDDGSIQSDWIGYHGGKEMGTTIFALKRGE